VTTPPPLIAGQLPNRRRDDALVERQMVVLLCGAAGVLLAGFSLAAFAVASFLLLNLPANTSRPARVCLGVIVATSLALMAGARPIDPNASNDIEAYHEIYRSLAEGDFSELTHFGGGVEVALPLLMYLWALILPPLSVNGLMFCLALTSSMLMLVWVEKTFYSGAGPQRPALLGICIVLMNLYFATQLSRQFISLIVLLYAFSASGRGRQAFYLALASAFHLTAIAFFAMYLLARRGWRGWLVIVVVALLAKLYFAQLLVAFDVLPEAAAEKLVYYVDNDDDSLAADIGSLRMIFLLAVISVVSIFASQFKPSARSRPWLAVPWVAAVVHYILLGIPLASLRTTLMVHSVASGLIAYKMLSGRAGRALTVVLNVLLLYKVAAFATAEQYANLQPTLMMLSRFLL
jgi:hypothetical protein